MMSTVGGILETVQAVKLEEAGVNALENAQKRVNGNNAIDDLNATNSLNSTVAQMNRVV